MRWKRECATARGDSPRNTGRYHLLSYVVCFHNSFFGKRFTCKLRTPYLSGVHAGLCARVFGCICVLFQKANCPQVASVSNDMLTLLGQYEFVIVVRTI